MSIKLPEYDEVAKKVEQLNEEELNPLEKFIHGPYECPRCGKWHLTTQKQKRKY